MIPWVFYDTSFVIDFLLFCLNIVFHIGPTVYINIHLYTDTWQFHYLGFLPTKLVTRESKNMKFSRFAKYFVSFCHLLVMFICKSTLTGHIDNQHSLQHSMSMNIYTINMINKKTYALTRHKYTSRPGVNYDFPILIYFLLILLPHQKCLIPNLKFQNLVGRPILA